MHDLVHGVWIYAMVSRQKASCGDVDEVESLRADLFAVILNFARTEYTESVVKDCALHIVHTTMNNMKKQDINARIRLLASDVGDFIRYWGFRRIHGEIWALVYLSEAPLSGTEIVERLQVSKALVSPALKELEDEGLIERVISENSKVKRYAAVDDVEKVIKGVLKRREKVMLEKAWKSYSALPKSTLAQVGYSPDRIKAMGAMIQMAQMGLQILLEVDVCSSTDSKFSGH